jgi:hypothetical protein
MKHFFFHINDILSSQHPIDGWTLMACMTCAGCISAAAAYFYLVPIGIDAQTQTNARTQNTVNTASQTFKTSQKGKSVGVQSNIEIDEPGVSQQEGDGNTHTDEIENRDNPSTQRDSTTTQGSESTRASTSTQRDSITTQSTVSTIEIEADLNSLELAEVRNVPELGASLENPYSFSAASPFEPRLVNDQWDALFHVLDSCETHHVAMLGALLV